MLLPGALNPTVLLRPLELSVRVWRPMDTRLLKVRPLNVSCVWLETTYCADRPSDVVPLGSR